MMRWPIGVAVVLGIVVLVNLAFAWVAAHGADPVDPTYESEHR